MTDPGSLLSDELHLLLGEEAAVSQDGPGPEEAGPPVDLRVVRTVGLQLPHPAALRPVLRQVGLDGQREGGGQAAEA